MSYAQFEQNLFILFVGLHFDLFSQLDDWFEVGVVLFLCLDQSIRYQPRMGENETNASGRKTFGNRGHLGYGERNPLIADCEREEKVRKAKKKFGTLLA